MGAAAESESTSSSTGEELVEELLCDLIELPPDQRPATLLAIRAQYPDLVATLQRRLDLLENALPPPTAAEVVTVFGRFELGRHLGGGTAEVFLARDTRDGGQVVVKILRHPELLDADVRASFAREAAAASRLRHPGIGPVLEVGEADGAFYLVQPFVAGITLAEWLRRQVERGHAPGPADVDLVLGWLEAIARALHAAHTAALVHRDVKPANILIPCQGPPQLLDFGLCQEVRPLTAGSPPTPVGGTLAYMAPELLAPRERPVGPAADIYALGVTLYECVTLHLPFAGDTRQDLCRAILLQSPPDPRRRARHLPRGIRRALACAMAKLAWDRYPSALAFAEDLARLRRGQRVQAPRPSPGVRLRRWVATHRAVVLPAGIAAALLLAVPIAERMVAAGEDRALEQLAIPERLHAAVARAAGLVPGWPDQVAALTDWLQREGRPLAALLPRLRTRVAGLAAGDGTEPAMALSLRAALEQLELFAAERGTLAVVQQRLEWASNVAALTLEAPAAAWQATAAAIAAEPRYHGLQLPPQLDLVPLGRDEASGLFEFYHPRSAWPGAPPVVRDPETRRLHLHDGAGLVFVLIPGSRFVMGQQPKDPNGLRFDPENVDFSTPEEVTLDPFFLSKCEMTQAQWQQLTGERPSYHRLGHRYDGDPPIGYRHPVESVSWLQCDEVLRCLGLRLPTEAQWEFACGAGAPSKWFFGDDPSQAPTYGNTWARANETPPPGATGSAGSGDGFVRTAPVGSYQPNPFGLYDMLGNVSEWCLDLWGSYAEWPPAPGDGVRMADPGRNRQRALRGSSCGDPEAAARGKTSARGIDLPDRRNERLGLRPARPLQDGWR